MEMKSIKFLLAGAAVALSCVTLAETETVGGYTWTYRLTADGKGAELYDSDYTPAISPDPEGAVAIPAKLGGKPVTSIGDYAFFECQNMTAVTIPATVTILGKSAFEECIELEHIALPTKLAKIGVDAFRSSAIRSVAIPDNVTEIADTTFFNAQFLECVQFGKKVNAIGSKAFKNCYELKYLVFKGNAPQVGEDAETFTNVSEDCGVWVPKNSKGWIDNCCGLIAMRWQGMPFAYGDCKVNVLAEAYSVKGGTGTVTGGGEYVIGKKVAFKAKADAGSVFCGWMSQDLLLNKTAHLSYALSYSDYTVTGESIKFVGRFITVEEDVAHFALKPCEVTTAADGTLDLDLTPYVATWSEPKLTLKGLPAGLKYDAKTFKITGKATKPGVYKVTASATNVSVKRAITAEWTITVPNFKDDLIKVEDKYGDFIPGYEYNRSIAAAEGCTVTGLPTGMKWTAKEITDKNLGAVSANSFYGAATKPGSYTVYFTKTVDKVKHTATATFTVGPFPKLNVLHEGNGTGKVTGEGEYPANKKVALKATADKGSVFMGWYDGKTLLSQAASFQYDMPYAGAWITANFITAQEDKDGVSIEVKDGLGGTVAMWNKYVSVQPGTPVELPCGVYMEWSLDVSALSLPTVKVSGLPAGLKFTAKDVVDNKTKDVIVPANTIYGVPNTPSKATKPSEIKITVTTAGKTVVEHAVSALVTAVPTWAAGQFNGGFDDGSGLATITVSSAGKISGKITGLGGAAITVSAANFESIKYDPVAEYETRYTEKMGNYSGGGVMTLTQTAEDLGKMVLWSYADLNLYNAPWKNEPWKSLAKKFTTAAAKTLTIEGVKDEDGNPGVLTLTFANTGAVTVKGVFTTPSGNYTASGSSTVTPVTTIANADDPFDACLYVALQLKEGKFAGFGKKFMLRWDGAKFSVK